MGRLSDDYYLICFAEQTGRARVPEAVAGLGLAGGLLAELVSGGHLFVHDGLAFPAVGVPVPADLLLREVLHVVWGQEPRPVETWLRFLAADAVTDIRARMRAAGLLVRVRSRRLAVTGRQVYLPTDSNAAAWPEIRLARQLCTGRPMPVPDGVLAGLVQVTGLLTHVLWGPEHAPGFAHADQVRRLLPPGLGVVVAHTEAAVGQRVLTRRGL